MPSSTGFGYSSAELTGEGRMPAPDNAQPINAIPDNVGGFTAMLVEATADQEEAQQEEA
jgi:hypothetical protein